MPLADFAFFFGSQVEVATNFTAQAYIAQLQALLDAQSVAATVYGLGRDRDVVKLADGRAVELQIDDFALETTGSFRELHGTLHASLLCIVRLDADTSEVDAFELAVDVATSLTDETTEGVPLMHAGPIQVTGVQPDTLDPRVDAHVACYSVSYQQEITIRRNVQPSDTAVTEVFLGQDPTASNPANYDQIVPEE